jgi:hypothetical protein
MFRCEVEIRNRKQQGKHKRRDKRKDKTQETKRIKQTVSKVTVLRWLIDNIHRNASVKDKCIGIYNMNQTVQLHVGYILFVKSTQRVQSYVQWIKCPECTRHIENPTEPIWLRYNRCDQRNVGKRFSPSYSWMSRLYPRADFVNRLRSDVSPSDGDTGFPFVYTTIRCRCVFSRVYRDCPF